MEISGVPISNLDIKDPMIIKWVLRQLENLHKTDKIKAEQIANQLLNDLSLKYILNTSNDEILTRLFHQLPPQYFSNNLNALINKWLDWSGTVACWSAVIIAQLDSQQAYNLFLKYIKQIVSLDNDINKLFGIIYSLKYMRKEISEELAQILINRFISEYVNAPKPKAKSFLDSSALELSWTYGHVKFDDLLQQYIVEYKREELVNRLKRVCRLLIGTDTDFNLICDHYYEYTKQKYVHLYAFFTPSSPLSDIDHAITSIKNGKYEVIHSLFDDYRALLNISKVQKTLYSLIHDREFITSLDKKEQQPFFYCFILGCLTSAFRTNKIHLENLSLSQVVEILSSDIEIHNIAVFIKFFNNKNKKDVSVHLVNTLKESLNHYGGKNIIKVMGHLGYDEFLPTLFRILSEDADFISSAGEKALLMYKDKFVDYFFENYKTLDNFALVSALMTASEIGGPKVAQLIDENLHKFWSIDKEMVLNAMENVPDESFIKLLEPHINKEQFFIDKAYILLNKLFKKDTSEIDLIKEKYQIYSEEKEEYQRAFQEGRLIDTVKPYIELELECKKCGDKSFYKIGKVISPLSEGEKPYIAEEVTCVSCGIISEFQLTPRGMMTIMAEILRLRMFEEEEDKELALEKSPIKFVRTSAKGKEMGVHKGIETYLSAIDKRPNNPENYIGLGNIYKNTNQFTKAEEYFKKAIEIDPSYIEVYNSLSDIYKIREDYINAFHWLDEGKQYIKSAKYRKDFEISKSTFGRHYVETYNDLIRESGMNVPVLHPNIFNTKVGRNEPCSCGSGKKYKKCCGKN